MLRFVRNGIISFVSSNNVKGNILNPYYLYEDTDISLLLESLRDKHGEHVFDFISPLSMDYDSIFSFKRAPFKSSLIEILESYFLNNSSIRCPVIIPLCAYGHWILAIFIPKNEKVKEKIDIYDSAASSPGSKHRLYLESLIDVRCKLGKIEKTDIESQIHCDGRQKDGYNCGPILVERVSRVICNGSNESLTPAEIPQLRKKQQTMLEAYEDKKSNKSEKRPSITEVKIKSGFELPSSSKSSESIAKPEITMAQKTRRYSLDSNTLKRNIFFSSQSTVSMSEGSPHPRRLSL